MNQRGRALLATVMLAGCTGGGDRVDSEQQKVTAVGVRTFNPEMPLMIGYNSLTDAQLGACVRTVKAENCAEDAPRAETSGFSDAFELSLVTSRRELKSKLGVEANLSARYKVVEVSASVNIEKESEFTSNSLTFLLKGESSYWTTLNRTDYRPELTAEARKLLDEENKPDLPSQFFVQCGNSWTSGYQRGAQFYVLITFTTSNKASRDSLEAKIKAELKLPVVGGKIEGGVAMANAAREFGAQLSIKVRADGFQWGAAEATNQIIADALGGELNKDTFKKFVEIHDAMVQSINNDRCIDRGFSRAKKVPTGWECVNDAPSPGKASHVLRINISDYGTVGNLPRFDNTWKPLINYQTKVDQATRYIAQLGALEDGILAAYYDEITPYLPVNDFAHARYGLAPPQIVPSNDPLFRLSDQDRVVNLWADRFKPPGGGTFARVHTAGKSCWAGVTNAEFDGCTCAGKADPTDRCLASLDAYRLSWNDLFEYRERGRVLPLQVFGPSDAKTYTEAETACDTGIELPDKTLLRGQLISYDEARRAGLYVANHRFGQLRNSIWYQNPPAATGKQCPQPSYSPADAARYIRPVFINRPQNVVGGQDATQCWDNASKTGALCVPLGGLFALNAYPDRLQGLPRPPPQVVAIDPPDRSIGRAPGQVITLTFTSSLDAATVTSANVRLKAGGTAVEAGLAYTAHPLGGGTVVITPAAPLKASTTYSVEVGTGLKGADGDAMLAAFGSTFTVANAVVNERPALGATGVALDGKIELTFEAAVNATTVNATTIKLWVGNVPITAAVSYAADTRKATLTPSRALEPSTMYTVVVSGVRDPGPLGNPVIYTWWTFTTGVAPTLVFPDDGATEVDRGAPLAAVFSGPLSEDQPAAAMTLKKNGTTAVDGTVTLPDPQLAPRSLRFRPAQRLDASTRYTVSVTTSVLDKDGKPAVKTKTWSFTTGELYTPDL